MYLYLLTDMEVIYFGVVGVPLQGHRGNCCPHAATANFACQPSNYSGTRSDAKLLPTREVGARYYMVHMNSTFYYYACSVYSARDGIELVYYTDATDTMMTT